MAEDERQRPKQRHRLLVNPEELGLTGRIKKALLERDMGLTQRIKRAADTMIQNKESGWHIGKYQIITICALFFICLGLGYLAFRNREFNLALEYPDGKVRPLETTATFMAYDIPVKLQDYERTVTFERLDPYGSDLSPQDFVVVDENGKKIQNPRSLKPGTYSFKVRKKGYIEDTLPVSISDTHMRIWIPLKPKTEPRRKLELYIADPLHQDKLIEPDDVRIKHSNKSIKNVAVKPGTYVVVIEKAGYHSKDVELHIPEDGKVREKIKLAYKDRAVKFLVSDGLSRKGQEPEIRHNEIKLIREGKEIEYKETLSPGYYDLLVKRDGYDDYQNRIKIVPAEDLQSIRVPLRTRTREIMIDPHYDIPPSEPKPDKAYLKRLFGSKEVIPITDGLKVEPQRYWLTVEKANYKPYYKEIFVAPGSAPFKEKAHLIAMNQLLILQTRWDFDVNPVVNPDAMDIDMRLSKLGCIPVDWGQLKQQLPPERKEIPIPIFLETIPRQVIPEIISDVDNKPVQPDILNLTRVILGGDPQPAKDLKPGSVQKFKPGRYMLNVQKIGYQGISEEIIIYPSNQPYVVKKKLQTFKRPLVLEIDTDYEPGKYVTPDEMKINHAPGAPGAKLKPGQYTLWMYKAGYFPIEKQIEIAPGNDAYVFKSQFRAKNRLVQFKITGKDFDEIKDLSELHVTFDGNDTPNNTELPPKKGYEVKIKNPGYGLWTENLIIEPSEDPYILKASLIMLKRKIILNVVASYPKGQSLMPVDKCMLGEILVDANTEVEPDQYEMTLIHTAYQPVTRSVDIEAGEEPFKIDVVMDPTPRPITTDITYAVQPEDTKLTPMISMKSEDGRFDLNNVKTGDKINPNNYSIEISAAGFTTIRETLDVPPSVNTFFLKRTMQPKSRKLVINVVADYPPNKPLQPDRILLDGEKVEIVSASTVATIVPGQHGLRIDKGGYQSLNKNFSMPAGVGDYSLNETLAAEPRLVTYKLTDAEDGKDLIPDSITLGNVAVTQTNPFKPGKYQLLIKLEGYQQLVEQLEILPDKGPYVIARKLIPAKRLVLYEIKGDYDVKPLTPKEITLNGEAVDGVRKFNPGNYKLAIYVPGYERFNGSVIITPSRDVFTIRENLICMKRKVRYEITADFPEGINLKPDKITFNNNPIVDGEEVKPQGSGYQVDVEKGGYLPLRENVVIEPSEEEFLLKLKMTARPRMVVFELDSEYQPGQPVTADEIRISSEVYASENPVPPGKHAIVINKLGHELLEFEQAVDPGAEPFKIKKTLITKPRPVEVKVLSDFDNAPIEAVELIEISGRVPYEETFKPGGYEVMIHHPGYSDIRDKIEIQPGEGPYQIEKKLVAKKREIIPNISFDIPPTQELKPHTIHVVNLADSRKISIELQGTQLKPGEYKLYIEKEGYESITSKPLFITPDDEPYPLFEKLIAKNVQILIDITHDIPPQTGHKDYKVTFIDSKGIGRFVSHGNFIKPGEHKLQIAQDGYEFRSSNEKITVPPGTEPYYVKRQLYAKPRRISFEMFDNQEKAVKAEQILINHKIVDPNDTFMPGKKYNMIAKFKDYKTAQRDVVIAPGEGPFVVDIELVKLEQFVFRLHKRFLQAGRGIVLDGVQYNLEIFVDGQPIEPHQIFVNEGGMSMKSGEFYAPKAAQSLRFKVAFYTETFIAKPMISSRDLKKIAINDLLIHLREVGSRTPGQVLRRVDWLLKDRQDRLKIGAMPTADREKLINLLRDLSLGSQVEREKRNGIIKQLQRK